MTMVPLSCRSTSWRAARSLSVSTARSAGSNPQCRPPSPDSGGVRVGRCEVEGEKPLADLLLPLLVPRRALLEAPSPMRPLAAGSSMRPAAGRGGCGGFSDQAGLLHVCVQPSGLRHGQLTGAVTSKHQSKPQLTARLPALT